MQQVAGLSLHRLDDPRLVDAVNDTVVRFFYCPETEEADDALEMMARGR